MKKVVTGLLIGLIVSILATIVLSNSFSTVFVFTTLLTLLGLLSIGVNGYKGCPSCDTLVNGSTSFCPRCGIDLKVPSPKKQQGGNLSRSRSARSTDLKASSTPLSPTVPSNHSPTISETLTAPTVPACPNCHAKTQANDALCGSCGYALEQTPIK